MAVWVSFIACAGLTFVFVGLSLVLNRRAGWLVVPGQRDSHQVPTPTGAGLAMSLALLVVSLISGIWLLWPEWWLYLLLPAFVLMSVVGWVDDRTSLSWKIRLVVQLTVSLALLVLLRAWLDQDWFIPVLALPGVPGPLVGFAVLLYVVWMMNAFNFMDGSNGLAAGQGLFAGVMMAILSFQADQPGLAMVALLIAASCLGFLPWNIPGARIFMGDSGSIPLGLVLAMLCLAGAASNMLPLAALLLLLAPFIIDATLTLAIRVARGERWYTAHRQHLYQKLMDNGWSHMQVLGLYQGINWILLGPSLWLMAQNPNLVLPLTGTLAVLLVLAWTIAYLKLGVNLEGQ